MDLVVPPGLDFSSFGFNTTIILPDLSQAIRQSLKPLPSSTPPVADEGTTAVTDIHSLYHNLASLQAILSMIVADYPHLVTKMTLGQSAEGRPVDALKLSTGLSSITGQPKPQIVLVGGQHAREWVIVSSMLFLAHTMVTELAHPEHTRPELSSLIASFDFVFVPCLNPDGYEYSWTTDRLWRKNRQVVSDECKGIDLNRNWGYNFASPQRPNPCLDTWPGYEAFDGVELRALRDYLSDTGARRVAGFIDLHSFGQMLLIPWSSDCTKVVKDYEDLTEAALGAAKRAEGLYGKDFEVGQACEVNYPSTGDASDWTYGQAGIKWSFAANLRCVCLCVCVCAHAQLTWPRTDLFMCEDRDLGTHGFLIPPDQIRPTGEEAMEMVLSLASFIQQKIKA